ncbi:MAG TPA: hypothetical protein PKX31_08485, partial [Chitinophagaceae bacterium]|nr:hypothetical protein [Chitinophagaceae bacterium]
MKKLSICLILVSLVFAGYAQDPATKKSSKDDKKAAHRQKINTLIKQDEEGVLVFRKQSIFGFQGRTNGYGGFYELGFMKTTRKTNIFRLDITEIKHQKQEKLTLNGNIFGNPFFYGKINNFYQAT